jgi:hypothetical protein
MRRALFTIAIALAGCKHTPATCKQLAPAILTWGHEEVANEKLVGEPAQKRQALFEMTAELYPRVCEKSAWSGDAIDCLIASKTEEDAQRCALTKDQREDLQKALMDALTADAPAPAKPK